MKFPDDFINQIICGDCLEILSLIPDNSIDMVLTSPPYNKHSAKRYVHYSDTWKNARIKYGDFEDNLPEDVYRKQQREVLKHLVRIIKPNGSIFYNHKARVRNHSVILPTEWLYDFNIRQLIIWDRGNTPQLAPIRWFPTTEYIFWITKTNVQPKFYLRSEHKFEVIRIPPKPMKEHPAPFPEELVKVFILNTTDEGDLVLDPFAGVGTVGKIAKQLGRNFVLIERELSYVDIAKKRIDMVSEPMELFKARH